MYVAVKGGEKAIAAAHALLARERRGDVQISEVTLEQLAGQLKLAVDRIMAEGSLTAELAALAFKQAQGDAVEAIFLLRAYRTTLPRFGVSEPMDTSRMRVERRISATWKDLPASARSASTFDYTHRLLDRGLAVPGTAPRGRGARKDGGRFGDDGDRCAGPAAGAAAQSHGRLGAKA